MSRKIEEPRIYKHHELMTDINEMMMRIKIHLEENKKELSKLKKEDKEKLLKAHPAPTNKELDALHTQIQDVLEMDYTILKH